MLRLASRYYLVPLLMLMAVWCGWFIHQSSFDIWGERYYSLFDDAMISMTYAKNLTQGHGLNWAKFGDPVEGFSSPLWTFLMVPFQLLPIGWGKVAGVFAGFCALILGANAVLLDRILYRRLGVTALLPRLAATFSLAFLYPLNYWSLVGMECGPQVLLFLLGMDQFLAFAEQQQTKHLFRLGWVLAAALLLRMDMVFYVFWVVVFLSPWLVRRWQEALLFLAIVGLPMASYLVFRWIYFHEILPNTYYLKVYKIPLDIRLGRAWYHFVLWAKPLWTVWVLVLLMMVKLWRNKAMLLSFLLVITYFGYNLYAGGDAWEEGDIGANRFTIIAIPWVLIILVAGANAWAESFREKSARIVRLVVPTLASFLVMVLVNGLLFVPHPGQQFDRLMVAKWPYNTEYQMWNVMKALDINHRFGTGNRVATVQAGDIGYFADCELVDLLGYNDHTIARGGPYWDLHAKKIQLYVPGHAKVDYRYAIGVLKPDYITDSWTKFNPEVEKEFQEMLIQGHYVEAEGGGWIREGTVRTDKP
jgi:hypothetical protein